MNGLIVFVVILVFGFNIASIIYLLNRFVDDVDKEFTDEYPS